MVLHDSVYWFSYIILFPLRWLSLVWLFSIIHINSIAIIFHYIKYFVTSVYFYSHIHRNVFCCVFVDWKLPVDPPEWNFISARRHMPNLTHVMVIYQSIFLFSIYYTNNLCNILVLCPVYCKYLIGANYLYHNTYIFPVIDSYLCIVLRFFGEANLRTIYKWFWKKYVWPLTNCLV